MLDMPKARSPRVYFTQYNPDMHADVSRRLSMQAASMGSAYEYAVRKNAALAHAVQSIRARANWVILNGKWVERPVAERKV